ncbi:MAG: GGDEF domain-containing protein [Actinomycetota bacterium]
MTGSAATNQATDLADPILAGRVAGLIPAVQRSMYTSVLSITVFGALLVRFNPIGLGIWLVVRLAVSAGCVAGLKRLEQSSRLPEAKIRWTALAMGISGAVWGAIPAFVRPEAPEWRAVVILWLFGNQAVVTAVASPAQPVFLAAIGSVTAVGAVGILVGGGSFGLVLAALLVLGGVYSVAIFAPLHRTVTTAISASWESNRLAESLAARQTELESTNLALTYLASHDNLTGLLNRRAFTEHLTGGAEAETLARSGWIGFVDVDNFKQVNDTHGHRAGDDVLVAVARRWAPLLAGCGGAIARAGGDEFTIALPPCTPEEAEHIAEQLLRSLVDPIQTNRAVIPVTCSIGLTPHHGGEPLAAVMARADSALYAVKAKGRNAWAVTPDTPGPHQLLPGRQTAGPDRTATRRRRSPTASTSPTA